MFIIPDVGASNQSGGACRWPSHHHHPFVLSWLVMMTIMMWFLDAMIPTADVWHSRRMSPMFFVTASREATWCPIMFLVLEVRALIINCQSSSYFFCRSDVPVIFVILLVIGCIVLAAIIGLLCMCLCKSLVAMICIFFFSCFSNSRHPISEKENGHVEKQTAGGK